MTGAMYAAVAGLRTQMQKMNVIGNNISNIGTYGYKAGRTTFKESLYTTLSSGSNGSVVTGGVNPTQLGFGCSIGSVDLDMSTKSYTPTGYNLDCMIDGDGFFLVGDKAELSADQSYASTKAKDLLLTRVGDLRFDPQGFLTDGQGKVVYGFVTRSETAVAGKCNTENPKTSGQLVPIRLPVAAKNGAAGFAAGEAIYPGVSATGANVYAATTGAGALTEGDTIAVNSVSIDKDTGKITAVNKADNSIVVVGYIPLASVTNPSGVTHVEGPYYRADEGAGECVAASIGNALKGTYLDNGTTELIGSAGTTKLVTGGLESSGTDLANEISEMISTQRGYQANTRVVTVTDAMLEELVNMKR